MHDVHLPTRSRRGAPPQGQRLTRGSVIARASQMIAADGLDAFSIRGLADALGVRPNALYNHVRSRDDLLDAVSEQFLHGLRLPAGSQPWPDWIRGASRDLRRQLGQRSGLTALAMDRAGATVAGPVLLGQFIDRLVAAGVDRAVAHLAWHAVLTVVVGSLQPEPAASGAADATFDAVLELTLDALVSAAGRPPSAEAVALLENHALAGAVERPG